MRGHSETTLQAQAAVALQPSGEREAAREVEKLAERLGLIDLPMGLHLLQMPRAAPTQARAFAKAASGAAGQCFEIAPTAFVLLFIGRDDAGDALEGRIARMLGEPAGRAVGGVAALRSLQCRSHDVVRGEWLLAELRRQSAVIQRPAA
jgi:hypothetical protein